MRPTLAAPSRPGEAFAIAASSCQGGERLAIFASGPYTLAPNSLLAMVVRRRTRGCKKRQSHPRLSQVADQNRVDLILLARAERTAAGDQPRRRAAANLAVRAGAPQG
jgi:hypothetical protein